MVDFGYNNWNSYLSRSRGEMQEFGQNLTDALQSGQIIIPQITPQTPNRAGGINHCPDSDLSYSTMAATVAATTPATVGDTNFEAYKFYRQQKGANLVIDAAHALKSVGHSLYAANEGATHAIPDWDRVNGWVEIGAAGATQYDVAVALLANLVTGGQPWYFRCRVAALNAAIVPAGVQLFAGLWEQRSGGGEGWIQGSAFDITARIEGAPGATSTDYRVLAKTDSGVSILSNVLTVANAPAAPSADDCVELSFAAGAGFIEFTIYKKVAGVFYELTSIRNSTDLLFYDTGSFKGKVGDWPADPGNNPRAYAESKNVHVAPYGSTWSGNDLTIEVPSSYNFSLAAQQFLRFGLTAPTAVDRHIGIDRIWLSTTFNEWAPDDPKGYLSGPSVSPTSGNQGGGGGVFEPPSGGSGGGTCVKTDTPVLVSVRRRRLMRRYDTVRLGDEVPGRGRVPQLVVRKRSGTVSHYYRIRTANGVTLECSAGHRLVRDLATESLVAARNVEAGMRLEGVARGRRVKTKVVEVRVVREPCVVGTFTLRDQTGVRADGEGYYVAGKSKKRDRGLFGHNVKNALSQ